jgi:hypothetical protein
MLEVRKTCESILDLPHRLWAVRDHFLIGTKRAVLGKFPHIFMQPVLVRKPKAQGFAFCIRPVFANKFEGSFRSCKGHSRSPCVVRASSKVASAIKKPNAHFPSGQ